MAISAFSEFLTLFEYSTVCVVYAFSLQSILRILWGLHKRAKGIVLREKNGLSNLLIANLVCWTILMGSALPHVCWMVANWRPEGRWINSNSVFWTTIITECMMAVIPYSLFFLTLDRIYSIQLLNGYSAGHRMSVLVGCVLTSLTIFGINLFAFISILPLPELTDCNVFACLMKNGNKTFIISKLFGGVLIILAGAYFLLELRKRSRLIKANLQMNMAAQAQQQNKIEPDNLVILMLCTELLLNFLPQLIVFIIQLIMDSQLATTVGPINHFLNCWDALISSLTYQHTLRRFIATPETSSSAANQQRKVGHQQPTRHQQRMGTGSRRSGLPNARNNISISNSTNPTATSAATTAAAWTAVGPIPPFRLAPAAEAEDRF